MGPVELGLLFIHRLLQIHTEHTCALHPSLDAFKQQYLFGPLIQKRDYLSLVLQEIKDRNICHFTDPLDVRLCLVRISDTICLLGPYVTETLSAAEIKKRFEEIGLDEKHIPAFQAYLQGLPLLAIDNLYFASHTLLQGAVGLNSKAIVYYVNLNESASTRLQAESAGSPVTPMPRQLYASVVTADENINLLYQLETTLTEQMLNGQTDNSLTTLKRMESVYRHGVKDENELELMKEFSVILCTKMRQTAIQAGVHPTLAEVRMRYFCALIRSTPSVKSLSQLCKEMLAQFCDLIRKEKLGSLSPNIRQVVQLIMADLSGNLNVETLAAQVNLSPNYLSTCFKKEMNQSLSSYIRDKRISAATQFMTYTNMPIRDIATCVGITDFSYFTKIFKEKHGVTPSAYRKGR